VGKWCGPAGHRNPRVVHSHTFGRRGCSRLRKGRRGTPTGKCERTNRYS
jgi:hypothetical protein